MTKKLIGIRRSSVAGPLFIASGQMHGNEPAGTRAIEKVLALLNEAPLQCGSFAGLIGNLNAAQQGKRYLSRDMNRQWMIPDDQQPNDEETRELLQTKALITALIAEADYPRVILLDLHTFSAVGPMFTIPAANLASESLASILGAPVITGMLDLLSGTMLHYYTPQNTGINVVAVAFEGGQHEDPESEKRCISAILNGLAFSGMLEETALMPYRLSHSPVLPRYTHLIYRKPVAPDDDFVMLPGFESFQMVEENQLLAHDRNGEIRSPKRARILMPLYQKQGTDGFFLLEDIHHNQIPH